MRHLFIINPAAGKHGGALRMMPLIQAYFTEHPADYRLHVTGFPGDATEVAREEAAAAREAGRSLRVYACGGDGTLLEVVNGVVEYPETEVASVPCGSGNDYVKSFGAVSDFLDLDKLVPGTARPVDGIRCLREGQPTLYSLNISSVGMDANVAYKMEKYKNWPLVSGGMAYNLAIVNVFLHRLGYQMTVTMETADGPVERQGKYLLALAASGQWYGGGYHGAPEALPGDGLLDFILADAIPRPRILQFLGKYKAGKHLGLDFIHVFKGTKFHMSSAAKVGINMDGECFMENNITFEIVPGMCRFVLPNV